MLEEMRGGKRAFARLCVVKCGDDERGRSCCCVGDILVPVVLDVAILEVGEESVTTLIGDFVPVVVVMEVFAVATVIVLAVVVGRAVWEAAFPFEAGATVGAGVTVEDVVVDVGVVSPFDSEERSPTGLARRKEPRGLTSLLLLLVLLFRLEVPFAFSAINRC